MKILLASKNCSQLVFRILWLLIAELSATLILPILACQQAYKLLLEGKEEIPSYCTKNIVHNRK